MAEFMLTGITLESVGDQMRKQYYYFRGLADSDSLHLRDLCIQILDQSSWSDTRYMPDLDTREASSHVHLEIALLLNYLSG